MAYQVIARKFRPQSFDDFVGQEHVTQTLMNALASDRFPHAILLTGPRGTGKTTTARIIAKTILCQNPKEQTPCGECRNCLDITEGNHLDVMEIDGASNNGVDHIRELRDTIAYMPSSGTHKIYIIDEVHMLSTSAFNALLKTLEEPPEHVIFIFATTEVQKIPATILSRCQRFDFRNHTLANIKGHLQSICEKENIKFDENALVVIAKQAKGSIRDSLTLLDQLISFSHNQLTLESVMAVLGLTDRNLLLSALKAIATSDNDLMFENLTKFKDSGYDPTLFGEEFLEILRNALLVKMGCHKNQSLDISEHELEELEATVAFMQIEEIHLVFDVSLSGMQRMHYSSDARLALEMLLFKLISLPRLTQNVVRPAQQPQPKPPTAKPTATVAPQKTTKATARNLTEPLQAPGAKVEKTDGATPEAKTQPEKKVESIPVPMPNPTVAVGKTWEEFVHAVKQANGFLGALLEHTSIYKQDKETIQLGLPEKMAFLLDKLQEPKNIERTQTFLESFWSDKRNIEVTLLDKNHIHASMSPKAMEEKARESSAKKEADSVEAHPLVQATHNVFKDNITKVSVINTPPSK